MENIEKGNRINKEIIEKIKECGFDKDYDAMKLNNTIDNLIGKALAELKTMEPD